MAVGSQTLSFSTVPHPPSLVQSVLTSTMGEARLRVANKKHAAVWSLIENSPGRVRTAGRREKKPFSAAAAVCIVSTFQMRGPKHRMAGHTLASGRS